MHGCSSGSLLVNAEVDSMGGVVDRGGGIGTNLFPQLAVIEETKAELRQHYVSYEEAKRQLDFLEKGGDPLDFRAGNAASLSVQSTSLADQRPEQFVTSEANGSFALAASPPGDSVESNGRPGEPPAYDPNSDDNLLLFDGENDFLKGERNSINSARSNIGPSEQSSQLDGSQNAKESGDSAAFGLPRKAYRRRNRSQPSRDGARSSSTDVVPSRGGHASFPSPHAPRDAKGLTVDTDNQKDRTVSSKSNLKATSPNCSMAPKVELPDSRLDLELDVVQAVDSAIGLTKGSLFDADQHNQFSESDVRRTPVYMAPGKPESLGDREQIDLAGLEFAPSLDTAKDEDQVTSSQMNGLSSEKVDGKSTLNEVQNSITVLGTKGLDSESSCTQTNLGLDGNIDGEICTNLRNGGSNGNAKEEIVALKETPNMEGDKVDKENNETKVDDICAVTNDDRNSFYNSHLENGSILKDEDPLQEKVSCSQIEVKDPISIKGMVPDGFTASENNGKPINLLGSNSTHESENACTGRLQGSTDYSIQETPATTLSASVSAVSPERNTCSPVTLKFAMKAHEDSILEEAQIIEAKRKRIAELSVRTLPLENHRKSHWDFVLEEMAWLANDFAQERLWKISAAAEIGHQAASASRLKFHEQNSFRKKKEVAHNLAKAVMDFWHWVEETSKEQELQKPGKAFTNAVQGYALRFLKDNSCSIQHVPAESPVTPDRMSDLGILDMSWEVHLTEENLFYSVPAGAMETYRKSIESHLLQFQKTGSSMQEEVETSGYDALAEFGSQENAFEEYEGETSTYYLPGAFDGSKQKKRKHLMKAYTARSHELGSVPFMQSIENKVGNHQSIIIGKRSANILNVLIPTKRVRTASRQRVLSPFNTGTSGCVQAPNKTDASSGDTNFFQDDQSTLQGGSHIPNSLEVESVRDFDKQLPFDSNEISHKPKKKKKAKNSGSTYEHKWQMDSNFQNEHRENLKRRLESHQLESNGSSGLYSQHVMKKPKMMKQSLDNSVDNLTPMGDSIPSPVASQMSNMSNPNKFIKMLGGRDRGRKGKALKTHAGQPGSGDPWSLFEDQALVVLVHDMGPNWELVSDAISSTLQFKCIFRKPKECKERHKVLMDSPAGDGADSAEDSGSSQPYRSTLPGIPKGSARQLFQRLQGPMEENIIKSHLEKIILIGKKQHHRRTQNNNQDPKQLQQPHNSHTLALSQVCPNNMTGGPVLMPLDLCDATASSPDVLSLGYQSPHTGGLPISNQGTVAPMLPASGVNPSVQVSSNVVLGSTFSSPSGPLNGSVRDGRFGIPRTASLSIDEQQRMQQYNQMLSSRNIQQFSMPVPGVHPGNDRGVRMLTGGNGVGIACGLNRSIPMARPGLQGIASSSMLNSGSMLSSGMVAMPNHVNVRSGPGSSQGNSLMRPHDALHMMQPTQSPEHQRQMIVPELQMQVSEGNSQGVSPCGGLSSSSNQTTQPSVQSYPLHNHQPHLVSSQQSHVLGNSHHPHLQGPNHATGTQHQAYAIRLPKERQIQHQHLLQQRQQQQQFAPSNALMPHVQGQSQLPVSSSLNTAQIQSQTSPPVPLSPLTTSSPMSTMSQHLQKHNMPPYGVGRNPPVGGGGLTNQMGKQRQHLSQQQQFQQAGRHHPQQRQQSQSHQQAKVLKGVGIGNMLMHQNLPIDHSLLNGLSTSGSHSAEKGEQFMHMSQGQGLYTGPGVNSIQPLKQLVPSHQAQPQQKLYSSQATPSKHIQQIPSHSDNSNQNHVQSVVAGPTLSTSVQAVPPPVISSSNPQQQQQQSQPQPQPHLKLVNQTQSTVQRVLHQNRQVNADPLKKLQAREAQADLHPVNNSSQMGTTAPVPGCVDVANVIPVVSSASVPQRKASETVYNPSMPNHAKQLGSGSLSLTNSGSEPPPPVSQGLGERQSSGSLPPVVHDGGVQRSKQSSQLQPPPPLRSLQQQPEETQQQQSQQETQHLRGGSNSLYVRSPSTLN